MLLGVILLVLSTAGCALFFFPPAWFPAAISPDAIAYDRQFAWTLWVCGAIFLAAQVLLAWVIFRGRGQATPNARPAHRFLEPAWTLATAFLFLGLAVAGSRSWARMPAASPNAETIEVYAHQFAWSFRYPGPDGRFGKTGREFINDAGGNSAGTDPADPNGHDDIESASLRIPADRDVLLLLHARDVIHDFFVRELRTKQDIVPGMVIPLALHVDRPGTYEIACAELCGLGHSQMRSLLIVLPPKEYARWKRQK